MKLKLILIVITLSVLATHTYGQLIQSSVMTREKKQTNELCGVKLQLIAEQSMEYIGFGKYSIGEYRSHYNTEEFKCLMLNTDNKQCWEMIASAHRKRKTAKVLLPIGIVAMGAGVVLMAGSGGESGMIGAGAVFTGGGVAMLISSITLRSQSNRLFSEAPLHYKPYSKLFTSYDQINQLGAHAIGIGYNYMF